MKKVLFIIALGISVISCSYEPVNEVTIVNNYYSKKITNLDSLAVGFPGIINDTIIIP